MGEKFPPRVWIDPECIHDDAAAYAWTKDPEDGEVLFISLAEHEHLIEEKELDYQELSRMHAALAAEKRGKLLE